MRTKDELLKSARKDIRDKNFSIEAALWLELRQLEVFIYIRDMIHKDIAQIIEDLNFIANKG